MAKKMTNIERKEARLRKGKQWLLTYTGSPKKMNKHYRERFHADNEIHSLPDQVCKGIKTFVTTVCHKDGIITILMKTIRSVQ